MREGRGQTIYKSPVMTDNTLGTAIPECSSEPCGIPNHGCRWRYDSARNTKSAKADNGPGVTPAGGESGLPLRPTSFRNAPEQMHKPVNQPSFAILRSGVSLMTRVGFEPTTYGLKVPQTARNTRPHMVGHGSAHHAFGVKTPPNRCRYSSDPSHRIETRTKMVSA